MEFEFSLNNNNHKVDIGKVDSEGSCQVSIDGAAISCRISHSNQNSFTITIDNRLTTVYCAKSADKIFVHVKGRVYEILSTDSKQKKFTREGTDFHTSDEITTPMPGKIVMIFVKVGDLVKPKQPLVIVESMKMENELKSSIDGTVHSVNFKAGDLVNPGQVIIKLSRNSESS
jgi:biotin carboxyl carrier protein